MIIIGVPCIGKTWCGRHYENCWDLESSDYEWLYDENANPDKEKRKGSMVHKRPNPDWPQNYIRDCLKYDDEGFIVLAGVYYELIDELIQHHIKYSVVTGNKEFLKIQIERAKTRGNSQGWIEEALIKHSKDVNHTYQGIPNEWCRGASNVYVLTPKLGTLEKLLKKEELI